MFRSLLWLVAGLASLGTPSLYAQEAVLGQEYGTGVHAFFAGEYVQAYEALTSAINGGSKDPRAYYFRGLAYVKLGRQAEAVSDFRRGAELESKDINRFYNVGKALERVQGPARSQLENYRVEARMIALEEEARLRKARYEAIQREESRVLREHAAKAPDDASKAVPPPAAAGGEEDPFATPDNLPRPAKKPATKKPAGDEQPKANGGGDEDPFASGGDEAKPKPKSDKKAAPKKGKPDDAGGDENPFGGGDDEKPAPKDKKPADKKPDAKKPDAKKPEKTDPDDPFGS